MVMHVPGSTGLLRLAIATGIGFWFIPHLPTQAQSIIAAPDGTGTIVTPDGNQLNITGGSLSADQKNLFHSFQQFGLSAEQVANFVAHPQLQNILGRISGGSPSVIDGLIRVTGGTPNLFLMNPAGIIFGTNAQLNVPAAFTVTTANGIAFGQDWFSATGANDYAALVGSPTAFAFNVQPGAIVNAGNLAVGSGQTLMLLGGTVLNTGSLTAPGGQIMISAVPGETLVRIQQPGNLLSFEVPLPGAPLPNANPIAPPTLPELLTGGQLSSANGVTLQQGNIVLTSTQTVIPTTPGTAIASGQLSTASPGQGGTIHILGDRVGLLSATLDASGSTGGGTILMGGAARGQGTLPRAQFTTVDALTTLRADAGTTGDGGQVVVWSDRTTRFAGTISATGGAVAGNGGWVEVSGQTHLHYRGSVDVTAPQGQTGTLLLDPTNITIVDSIGAQDAELGDHQIFAADGGAGDFLISVTALKNSLLSANTILEATNDITWLASAWLDYDGIGVGKTLELRAGRDITIAGQLSDGVPDADALNVSLRGDRAISITGTLDSGTGDITLVSDKIDFANTLRGQRSLTLQTATPDLPIQLGGSVNPGAVLDLTTTELSQLAPGFAQINIGTPTNPITLMDNLRFNAPLTLTASTYTTTAGTLTLVGGLTLNATQSIAAGDVIAPGRAIALTSGTTLTAGLINTSFGGGTGGNITLTAGGDLQVSALNTQAGAGGTGGSVTLTSGQLLRVTDTFTALNDEIASISTFGWGGSGNITLSMAGGTVSAPFTIGNATTNGTAGVLTTSLTTVTAPQAINTILLQGNIQVTNSGSPPIVPPPVLPLPAPPGSPPASLLRPILEPPAAPSIAPTPPTAPPSFATVLAGDAAIAKLPPAANTAELAFDPRNPVMTTAIAVNLDAVESTLTKQFQQHLELTEAMTAGFLEGLPPAMNNWRSSRSSPPTSTSTATNTGTAGSTGTMPPQPDQNLTALNLARPDRRPSATSEIGMNQPLPTAGRPPSTATGQGTQGNLRLRQSDGGQVDVSVTAGGVSAEPRAIASNRTPAPIQHPEHRAGLQPQSQLSPNPQISPQNQSERQAASNDRTAQTRQVESNSRTNPNGHADANTGNNSNRASESSLNHNLNRQSESNSGNYLNKKTDSNPGNTSNRKAEFSFGSHQNRPTNPNAENSPSRHADANSGSNSNRPADSNPDKDQNQDAKVMPNLNGAQQDREDQKVKAPQTVTQAQARLQQVMQATGVKPALLYVLFTAASGDLALTAQGKPIPTGKLTLVLVPPTGAVVAKQVEGITRSQVLQMADQMRRDITSPLSRRYLLPAQKLHQWLIAPIEAELQANQIQTLAVITESGLRSLPISALNDGKQFLIEKYSVALMPSLDLTDTRLADIRQVKMLAMGASTFGKETQLSDLPAVPVELAAIAGKLWAGDAALNTEFTLENLTGKRSRQPYGIIHLATHADFQSGNLSNSYIQLWNKRLRLDQVRRLNWSDPPVSLVVLSACRTALGDAEAELGFAGFAVKAGAQSALASLWYVSDEGTLGFMTEFYRQLRQAPIKAEALRKTQIAMLTGQVKITGNQLQGSRASIQLPDTLAKSSDLILSHPFYWASFTLIGSPW